MNSEVRLLLRSLRDPLAREDAEYRYEERCAVCFYEGLLSEVEAQNIALKELRDTVNKCLLLKI